MVFTDGHVEALSPQEIADATYTHMQVNKRVSSGGSYTVYYWDGMPGVLKSITVSK
jgi:hypothetical protein